MSSVKSAALTSTPAIVAPLSTVNASPIVAGKADPLTLARAFCQAFTVHPATKDKTPKGIASRVAVGLNRALGHTSCRGTYWTGADVLAFCVKEGITLGA